MSLNIEKSLQIRDVPVSTIKLAEYNPRQISDSAFEGLKESLKKFGMPSPLVINVRSGILVSGHQRLKAATALGWPTVPAVEVDLSPAEEKALNVTLNNRHIAGDFTAGLAQVLDDVRLELGDDFMASLRLDDIEIPEINLIEGEEAEPEPATPELPVEPKSKPGDLWTLGKHRLLCGDSTNIQHVEKLMDGQLADLVFTDPPYNVDYSGRGEQNNLGGIMNDAMTDEKFLEFCRGFFSCYFAVMKPLACIYVCHPDSASGPKIAFEQTFSEKFHKASTIIWMKQSAGMGWQDYRAQHEPILYGWKPGDGPHYYCGDRAKTTVWQIGRDAQASYVHPTQKPVDLPTEAIRNSSKPNQIVLDLFGGSGSTMMACERAGRKNRSMELDPRYVDVIVKRWADYTKQDPVRDDGKKWSEL